MIIIEIMRNFSNFDRLLGEHRWSEVFQNPTPENRERVSKIFYCKYSTGREVQKHGESQLRSPSELDYKHESQVGSASLFESSGSHSGVLSIGQ